MHFHEDLSRTPWRRGPSDRRFGFEIAAMLAVVGLWQFHWNVQLFLAVVCFFAIALIRPRWLRPLNYVWTRAGVLLAYCLNPIVCAILFYLVFTPLAVIVRLLG